MQNVTIWYQRFDMVWLALLSGFVAVAFVYTTKPGEIFAFIGAWIKSTLEYLAGERGAGPNDIGLWIKRLKPNGGKLFWTKFKWWLVRFLQYPREYVFNWDGRYLYWEKFFKPLTCEKCLAGQIALWSSLVTFGFDPVAIISTVSMAIVAGAWVNRRLYGSE